MSTPGYRGSRDWAGVAKAIDRSHARRPGRWYLLGRDERRSVAQAIRQGSIAKLRGCEVITRNNHTDEQGIRRCDIYLRRKETQDANSDSDA